jgi:riboflavin synthase alpha subunit
LKSLKSGDPVNLEVDMIAKYVEKMMTLAKPAAASSITIENLVSQGF